MSENEIHIKKANRGKFTDYCGGKVTDACILKAKASGNTKLIKRATFAENVRKLKHLNGGKLIKKALFGISTLNIKDFTLDTYDAYLRANDKFKSLTGNSIEGEVKKTLEDTKQLLQNNRLLRNASQLATLALELNTQALFTNNAFNDRLNMLNLVNKAYNNMQSMFSLGALNNINMSNIHMNTQLAGSQSEGSDLMILALGLLNLSNILNLLVLNTYLQQYLKLLLEEEKQYKLQMLLDMQSNLNSTQGVILNNYDPSLLKISEPLNDTFSTVLNLFKKAKGGKIESIKKFDNGGLFTYYKMVAEPEDYSGLIKMNYDPSYSNLNVTSKSSESSKPSTKQSLSNRFSTDLGITEHEDINLNSSDLKRKVINFFTDKGLTTNLAAGIYGNLMLESLLNINAVGDKGTSEGILLWHNERKTALNKYQKEHGKSLDSQLNFLWDELNSDQFKKALADLKLLTTVDGATKSFMLHVGKPKALYANLPQRIKYALS